MSAAALDAMKCATCSHDAVDHFSYMGPCAECWREVQPICKRFVLADEDRDKASAAFAQVFKSLNPVNIMDEAKRDPAPPPSEGVGDG